MKLHPCASFIADFPDDMIEEGGEIIQFGGGNVAAAIANLMRQAGYDVSQPEHQWEKGWDFVVTAEGRRIWLRISDLGGEYYLVHDDMSPLRKAPENLRIRAEVLRRVSLELSRDERFHDLLWNEEPEIGVGAVDPVADTPSGQVVRRPRETPGPYLQFALQDHREPQLTLHDLVAESLRGWDDERRPDFWTPSLKRGAVAPSAANLAAAINAELVPPILAEGWALIQRPAENGLGTYGFVRTIDGLTQVLALHLKKAAPFLIAVRFLVVDERFSAKRRMLCGGGQRTGRVHLPQKLFRGLTEQDGPISYLIDIARRELRDIEAFLKTGERSPRIYLGPGAAKKTWPIIPKPFRSPPEWEDEPPGK